MLKGEHRCALDEKGRLNFPSKFRERMGESFTVTRWLDNCLIAFPAGEWERISALLAEKGLAKSRDIKRFLFSGASDAVPDKQGRILIPPPLRKHAGLQKDIIVIGVGRYAEIWDVDAWETLNNNLDNDAIAAAMEELDI